MTTRRNRLARCTSGVTTIEFAFLVPVFLMMVMGIIEFALIVFTMSVMETATSVTARMGKTGFSVPGQSRQDEITANIRSKTAGLLNPANIHIVTTVYPGFNSVGQPEPYTDSNHNHHYDSGEPYTDVNGNGHWDDDMGASGAGNGGDVVVYTVTYAWPIMTPVISAVLGSSINLSTRTVVKNEPF